MHRLTSTSQPLTFPSDQDATGRTLGDEERRLLGEAIKSGTLTSTKGHLVASLEERFAATMGIQYALACNSGTAAIHAAVAAVDPEPGDEIITTPITDMGAITPILYQGAIPVFADVDPDTCNVTAETIAARLSERTRAIVVTHLFGNPCNMPAIMNLARQREIPVIEDCAQAYLAQSDGRWVGTWGDIGCFSLQQGKHITTGEGGLLTTDNPDLHRRMRLFINKAWGYGDERPDHYFLALNYRMCELQGAVALAQLDKLADSVRQRVHMAELLSQRIEDIPGIAIPPVAENARHTYWKYCLRVDQRSWENGTDGLGQQLRERGIANAPRYIKKPAFECQVIRDQRTFGNSRFPFTLARPEAVDYRRSLFPGVYRALADVLVLAWNERYAAQHVEMIAATLREAALAQDTNRD
jgi:dTDP-4-amino-4,6-dideoxygalactose transaminase